MKTRFQDRHSGRDSHQAILPDALRVNANLFQRFVPDPLERESNPGSMDVFETAIHGTRFPLPCGYDELARNLTT